MLKLALIVTAVALARLGACYRTFAAAQPWGAVYRASLAQPGLAGSNLAGRLTALEGRLFAKTGTITHVNGLSGYLVAGDGRELLFSIMTNATGRPAPEVRAAMDHIVTEAANAAPRRGEEP